MSDIILPGNGAWAEPQVREIRVEGGASAPNTMRVIYDPLRHLVWFETMFRQGGAEVATTIQMDAAHFRQLIAALGVM